MGWSRRQTIASGAKARVNETSVFIAGQILINVNVNNMSETLFPLEITHTHLVNAAYKWVLKSGGCGVAFREFNTGASNGEYPDVIGFYCGGSLLIECKASRSDFHADKTKRFRQFPQLGMGTKRYYCCPVGLLKFAELPKGWGLLEVNGDHKVKATRPLIRQIRNYPHEHIPDYEHEKNLKAEHELMYSALRRLHIRGRIEEVYDERTK